MRIGRRLGAAAALMLAAPAACTSASGSERLLPKVRIAYAPNVTHAPALIGVAKGFFAAALAGHGRPATTVIHAGPEAVQGLFSKALDIAYLGATPAINAYEQSGGEAIRIIAGATSGGAGLVVASSIHVASDLRGRTLSSPQLGNTQDVALRAWLLRNGLRTTTNGGGAVSIRPQSPASILTSFATGDIDGAWVPEPWLSRMIVEAGGHLLVDERSLWPGGRFITTQVVVRTVFLDKHPDVVEAFLRGHLAALDFLGAAPAEARHLVATALTRLTGTRLSDAVIERAWPSMTFSADPLPAALRQAAADAARVGVLKPTSLRGIFALDVLNRLRLQRREPAVSAA